MIGVLKDTAPLEMAGILEPAGDVSDRLLRAGSADDPLLLARPGVDAEDAATCLESAFLPNGMQAESIQKVLDDTLAANRTFNRLIQGFMGLGLIVGVAALGVISARAVVESASRSACCGLSASDGDGAGGLPDRIVVHRADLDPR